MERSKTIAVRLPSAPVFTHPARSMHRCRPRARSPATFQSSVRRAPEPSRFIQQNSFLNVSRSITPRLTLRNTARQIGNRHGISTRCLFVQENPTLHSAANVTTIFKSCARKIARITANSIQPTSHGHVSLRLDKDALAVISRNAQRKHFGCHFADLTGRKIDNRENQLSDER